MYARRSVFHMLSYGFHDPSCVSNTPMLTVSFQNNIPVFLTEPGRTSCFLPPSRSRCLVVLEAFLLY